MKGDRVAQLELILRSHPEGMRKSDIARRMGIHRSTVGRYIEELKSLSYAEIYEDGSLVKIKADYPEEKLDLSVYESLAINLGAEMLLSKSEFRNPHLASGLRKIGMNMKSYAPTVAGNIISLAEEVEDQVNSRHGKYNSVLEVLIDAWTSGRMVKVIHTKDGVEEETELAPYFIGFVEGENGRNPITVTGRLRHTTEIVTIDIVNIKDVQIMEETYTIPDNLKAFNRRTEPGAVSEAIDTIQLVIQVKEKSALNIFRSLAHGEIKTEKQEDGTYVCSFEAENSIELVLRIIQGFDSIKILGPEKFRDKFVSGLSSILALYK